MGATDDLESWPRTGWEFSEITKKLHRPQVWQAEAASRADANPARSQPGGVSPPIRYSACTGTERDGCGRGRVSGLHFSQEIASGWTVGCKGMGSSPEERKKQKQETSVVR